MESARTATKFITTCSPNSHRPVTEYNGLTDQACHREQRHKHHPHHHGAPHKPHHGTQMGRLWHLATGDRVVLPKAHIHRTGGGGQHHAVVVKRVHGLMTAPAIHGLFKTAEKVKTQRGHTRGQPVDHSPCTLRLATHRIAQRSSFGPRRTL